jgi:hypothetical protein
MVGITSGSDRFNRLHLVIVQIRARFASLRSMYLAFSCCSWMATYVQIEIASLKRDKRVEINPNMLPNYCLTPLNYSGRTDRDGRLATFRLSINIALTTRVH